MVQDQTVVVQVSRLWDIHAKIRHPTCFHTREVTWILTTSVLFFPPSDPLRHLLGNNIRHAQPGPCSSHLLMPVLSKPHHLIHNALQGGQQGWMEFPLHMHDSAAAPHRGSGSDWPRVRSAWVRLGTHRTRLLLPWSIWWHYVMERVMMKNRN